MPGIRTTTENIWNRIFTDPLNFSRQLHRWRFLNKSIVFTNGCFDLIHPGHIHLLSAAADMGDVLLVGLNSDASVQRLKGAGRPRIPQDLRAMHLASLFFVDAVVLFEEDTPMKLIEQVRPDVLVKGSDYSPNTIVGADFVKSYGGRVEVVELLPGFSSSLLLN
ncbi:MAG: adenylyltransferase/cytidyltransferase family protein [Flavobacteriales bacterium]|nr:adenylyltransferase/cytidyltransferase family protein [Flavobacteriales bacterium]MCX7769140.1 adenylyltransferase/cytidyltransferase family protein [Flavobacteriales bacterium]MDW8410158.1 adenylyltransferase/cytidyltransferase family protein [Flavobacteriales bacterium]